MTSGDGEVVLGSLSVAHFFLPEWREKKQFGQVTDLLPRNEADGRRFLGCEVGSGYW